MTPLRLRMIEDMRVRNLAVKTQKAYLTQVTCFAKYFEIGVRDRGRTARNSCSN